MSSVLPASASTQEIADELFRVKKDITDLNNQSRELGKYRDELEQALIQHLDDDGYDQIRTELATFSRKEEVVPVAKDWDSIHGWILENQATHLLQRRLSAGAYRDLIEEEYDGIPGIEPFTKVTISTRKR